VTNLAQNKNGIQEQIIARKGQNKYNKNKEHKRRVSFSGNKHTFAVCSERKTCIRFAND
jgi:hypothetical protein